MTRAAVTAAAIAASAIGCVSDHYECEVDTDCNLGDAGRCEVDHHCTVFDGACATGRRYTPHSGDLSDACYEPVIGIANPCASGQPAAESVGCAATVCSSLPSCCTTGWSQACVQRAQLVCPEVTCDLRVAITASRNNATELWDAGFDGGAWSARQPPMRDTLLGYLAPLAGDAEPRLTGLTDDGATLVIGEGDTAIRRPLTPGLTYQDFASVDFDRDVRDTIALGWQDTSIPAQCGFEIVKLGRPLVRSITTDECQRSAWGDYDQNAFPDPVAGIGTRYTLFTNADDGPGHGRTLIATASNNVSAGQGGVPALRAFDWTDVDGDGLLDVVVFGNATNVHLANPHVDDIPLVRLDCDPPYVIQGGNACATFDAINFAGAAVPMADGTSGLVIGNDVTRNLYRITIHHTDGGDTVDVSAMTLGLPCVASECQPIRAVIVRDLDGDHAMDVVAIDAVLRMYVTLTTLDPTGLQLTEVSPIPRPASPYTLVRVSITGALQ